MTRQLVLIYNLPRDENKILDSEVEDFELDENQTREIKVLLIINFTQTNSPVDEKFDRYIHIRLGE